MLFISFIDFEWILSMHWLIYGVNLFLLLWVEFFGVEYNNAKRWIDLKVITLKPSDLTKIFMVLFFAKFLLDHEKQIKEPKTILKAILLIAPSLFLILKQPNLSNTICIAAIFFVRLVLG